MIKRGLLFLTLTLSSLAYSHGPLERATQTQISRRVHLTCEMRAAFGVTRAESNLGRLMQTFASLDSLLQSYAKASSYYEVPSGGTADNLPSQILGKIGLLKVSLKPYAHTHSPMAKLYAEVQNLGFEIHQPYADLQNAMIDGIDPESAEGDRLVQNAFQNSVGKLYQQGWLGNGGASGARFESVYEALLAAGLDSAANSAYVDWRRAFLTRVTNAMRPAP